MSKYMKKVSEYGLSELIEFFVTEATSNYITDLFESAPYSYLARNLIFRQ